MRLKTLCILLVGSVVLASNLAFAAAPTTQPTGIGVSGILSDRATVSWNNGNGAARIVLCNESSSTFPNAVNGTRYENTNQFGNGSEIGVGTWVVMNQSATSVQILNLSPNTLYWVKVCEYNTPATPEYNNTGTVDQNVKVFVTAAGSGSSVIHWIRY